MKHLTPKNKGLDGCRFGPRAGIEPARGPEAKAPLAKPAAPVALQQCRILQATPDDPLQGTDHQPIESPKIRNPVLNCLPVRF
jgi:hypothetical protein